MARGTDGRLYIAEQAGPVLTGEGYAARPTLIALGPEWTGCEPIAQACLLADLTQRQSDLVRMGYLGLKRSEIAEAMGVSVARVDEWLLGAERRLRRYFSDVEKAQVELASQVVRCVRNREIQDWEVGEAEPPVRGSAPVGMVRARPFGMSVADLVGSTRAFFEALFGELAGSTVVAPTA